MTSNTARVIEDVINPWIGAADDDVLIERYWDFNPNDQKAVINAVQSDLLDGYRRMDEPQKERVRQALLDVTLSSDYEIERLWDSQLPPFDLPERRSDLFRWIAIAFERDDLKR